MTTNDWFTGSVPFSFEESPKEWREGVFEYSLNTTKQPNRMQVKIGGHNFYTMIQMPRSSEEAEYSASLAYWHLVNTGSEAGNWADGREILSKGKVWWNSQGVTDV